jgi:hypothetical protein
MVAVFARRDDAHAHAAFGRAHQLAPRRAVGHEVGRAYVDRNARRRQQRLEEQCRARRTIIKRGAAAISITSPR